MRYLPRQPRDKADLWNMLIDAGLTREFYKLSKFTQTEMLYFGRLSPYSVYQTKANWLYAVIGGPVD